MSWQAYVDNQICKLIPCKLAYIAGLADGAVWASHCELEKPATQQELKVIIDTMRANPPSFLEKGVHLAGEKYICLLAEPNLVRGRKGSRALCIVSTKTCLLVAVTDDGQSAGNLNTVVEQLGDYLISCHF